MNTPHTETRADVLVGARTALDELRAERDTANPGAESANVFSLPRRPSEPAASAAEIPGDADHRADDECQAGANKKESQATAILRLVTAAGAELFHTAAGDSYITIRVNGHQEHHPLDSRGSRDYLTRILYLETGRAPSAAALQAATATLSGIGRFDGSEHEVYVRVAGENDRIYLDLGDPSHRAVEITSTGWQIVADSPVRFRRPRGLLPLPVPAGGGSIADLRPFVNVATDDAFVLLVMGELAAFRPRGPYPIMVFIAEQGAAKTTTTRVLRRLCDPNDCDVRRPPRNTEDLMIAATNGHVVAFDNLSRLPEDLSDNLSVLATGGGFAVRQLYTNREEELFQAQRPIILNGISLVATRSDLLDRAIVDTLPPIPEEHRKDEATFWSEFDQARPRILGALLDAVSCGLRRGPDMHLERKPRMADFAVWGVAVEPACPWPAGTFLRVYAGNRQNAVETILDGDPVAEMVQKLAPWTGTASEFLAELTTRTPASITMRKDWFVKPRQVSDALRRLAPSLRRTGIEVTFHKHGHNRTRLIEIARAQSSASSVSSACPDYQAETANARQSSSAGSPASSLGSSADSTNASRGADAADDADAGLPHSLVDDEWEQPW